MAGQRVELTRALLRVKLPAFVADREGVITWANEAMLQLFGDVRGRHFTSFVAPEDTALVRDQHARKILGGADVTDYEATFLDVEGRRVPVEISSVPIEDGVFGLAVVGEPVAGPGQRARTLTPRQLEILQLLAAGTSTEQVADTLTISRETVRNHIRHILRALDAHSRLEAVATARAAGLLRRG